MKKTEINSIVGDLFVRLHYKINFNLRNSSNSILGTDLLRDNIRRNLFRIVTLRVENKFLTLIDQGFTKVDTRSILLTLIKESTEDFLTENYGYCLRISKNKVYSILHIQTLLNDARFLVDVPLYSMINPDSRIFRSAFTPIYNTPTPDFIEAFIDNLIVEISNGVMYLIIHEFSHIYDIRQNLYRTNFLSMRNIERFKNNLAWATRIKTFVRRPLNMYDSQYGIWVIRTNGIYYRNVYANRSNELLNLNNASLITVTYIEFQDFIISRFDEALYLFGNGIRYTLTSVIGQIIGLIWRGVIEGLKK
jgi:hypothetical protein